eukprot:gene9560-12125_t
MSSYPMPHPASLPAPGAVRASAWMLAAAGTLPFLGGLVDLALLGGGRVGVVQIYGAVIAAFLCGTHWAAALLGAEAMAVRLFLLSNALALLGWAAALLPARPGFLLLGVIFAGLLAVDGMLHRRRLWPDWFWQLRCAITLVVVSACAGLAVA